MTSKSQIHPTAVVDPSAVIGEDTFIGPFCLIGPNVKIGTGNRLEAYVSIGTAAEHRDYFRKDPGPVVIGNNNVLREFVAINGGTTGVTNVGSGVTIQKGSYVGHDAVLRDKVIVSCNVMVAGHSIIGEGANLGLSSAIHQNRCVGAYAMIGMNSAVMRHAMPFSISFGNPCEVQRVNRIGLQRAGVSSSQIQLFEDWFQISKERPGADIPLRHEFNKYLQQFIQDRESFEIPPVHLVGVG